MDDWYYGIDVPGLVDGNNKEKRRKRLCLPLWLSEVKFVCIKYFTKSLFQSAPKMPLRQERADYASNTHSLPSVVATMGLH